MSEEKKQVKHLRTSKTGKKFYAGSAAPKSKISQPIKKKQLSEDNLKAALVLAKKKGDVAAAALIAKRLLELQPTEPVKKTTKKKPEPKKEIEKKPENLKTFAEKAIGGVNYMAKGKLFLDDTGIFGVVKTGEDLTSILPFNKKNYKTINKPTKIDKSDKKLPLYEIGNRLFVKKMVDKAIANLDNPTFEFSDYGNDPLIIKDKDYTFVVAPRRQMTKEEDIDDLGEAIKEIKAKISREERLAELAKLSEDQVKKLSKELLSKGKDILPKETINTLKWGLSGHMEFGIKELINVIPFAEKEIKRLSEKAAAEKAKRIEEEKKQRAIKGSKKLDIFLQQKKVTPELKTKLNKEIKRLNKTGDPAAKKAGKELAKLTDPAAIEKKLKETAKYKFIPPLQRKKAEEFTTPEEARELNRKYKAGLRELKKLKDKLGEGYKEKSEYKALKAKTTNYQREYQNLKKEFQTKAGVGQFGEKPKSAPEIAKEVFKQAAKDRETIKKGLEKAATERMAEKPKKKQATIEKTLSRQEIAKQVGDLSTKIRQMQRELTKELPEAKKKQITAELSMAMKKRIALRQQAKALKEGKEFKP